MKKSILILVFLAFTVVAKAEPVNPFPFVGEVWSGAKIGLKFVIAEVIIEFILPEPFLQLAKAALRSYGAYEFGKLVYRHLHTEEYAKALTNAVFVAGFTSYTLKALHLAYWRVLEVITDKKLVWHAPIQISIETHRQ